MFGLPNESPGASGISFGGDNGGGGFSPDSRNMGPLQAPGDSPYSQNPDHIESINQVSSTPFKIVDIQPYYVDAATYPCIYKKELLTQLVGPEGIFEEDFNATQQTATPAIIRLTQTDESGAYWRTVALPFVGNFLKIESLPLKNISIGDFDVYNSLNLPNPEFMSPASDISKSSGMTGPGGSTPLAGSTPNVVDQDFWYTFSTGGINYYPNASVAMNHMSKQMFLVSFDSQNAIPLVAYSGTVFKCPYNQVFITFKTGAGPIRVTSGYNSEIVDRPPDVDGNSNLAMRSPTGFLERPLLHFVPFCTGTANVGAAGIDNGLTGGNKLTYVVVEPLGTISPEASNFHQDTRKGVSVLWITNISAAVATDPDTGLNSCNLCLYIGDSSKTLRRIVWQKTFISYNAAANANNVFQSDISFAIPIRVCLKTPSEFLYLQHFNSGSSGETKYLSFSMTGYTYGRWRFENMAKVSNFTPMVLLDLMNEHPYFLDSQRTLSGIANQGTGYVTI